MATKTAAQQAASDAAKARLIANFNNPASANWETGTNGTAATTAPTTTTTTAPTTTTNSSIFNAGAVNSNNAVASALGQGSTTSVPVYNFTQTPAQNAAAGNNSGYTKSSGTSTVTPTLTSEVVTPTTVGSPVPAPALRGLDVLGKQYGITYNEQAILDKFNAATQAQYDMLRKEYGNTENQFFSKAALLGQTAMDTIRKSHANAVATGASRGMQAANEVSAMLGLEQAGTQEATLLAQNKQLLDDKQGAAQFKNVVDAQTTSNSLKQALANLDSSLYAADTQGMVGGLDYTARIDAAKKALEGVLAGAEAQTTVGLAQADATKYNADQNLAGVNATNTANTTNTAATIQGNKDINANTTASNEKINSNTTESNEKINTNTIQGNKDTAAITAQGYVNAAIQQGKNYGNSAATTQNPDWMAQLNEILVNPKAVGAETKFKTLLALGKRTPQEAQAEWDNLIGKTNPNQPEKGLVASISEWFGQLNDKATTPPPKDIKDAPKKDLVEAISDWFGALNDKTVVPQDNPSFKLSQGQDNNVFKLK